MKGSKLATLANFTRYIPVELKKQWILSLQGTQLSPVDLDDSSEMAIQHHEVKAEIDQECISISSGGSDSSEEQIRSKKMVLDKKRTSEDVSSSTNTSELKADKPKSCPRKKRKYTKNRSVTLLADRMITRRKRKAQVEEVLSSDEEGNCGMSPATIPEFLTSFHALVQLIHGKRDGLMSRQMN